jgi:hypothetical protein
MDSATPTFLTSILNQPLCILTGTSAASPWIRWDGSQTVIAKRIVRLRSSSSTRGVISGAIGIGMLLTQVKDFANCSPVRVGPTVRADGRYLLMTAVATTQLVVPMPIMGYMAG